MTNVLLGFLISHLTMNVYSAISGNMPSSIVPGLEFTPTINIIELMLGLALIAILSVFLFSRKRSEASQTKTILRILNGALVFGAFFAFSETNWLLLGVCLVLTLPLLYIIFFRG